MGYTRKRRRAQLLALEGHLDRFRKLSDNALTREIEQFQHIFSRDWGTDCRPETVKNRSGALALLSVCMERELGMTPYRVQHMAALAMHQGAVVQLAPGEGKTLALALVGALYGWTGRPCHMVTANDYLAERDATLMAPFYQRCGLSVSAVLPQQAADERRQNYSGHVVYATGSQLLADFLRDELLISGAHTPLLRQLRLMQGRSNHVVMQGLFAAVVDEADSVFVDEANTPLIISGSDPNPRLHEVVPTACSVVDQFVPGRHYRLDGASLSMTFTDEGEDLMVELTRNLPPMWRNTARREELIRQALTARDVFQRGRHYIVADDKVVIIDENTGRSMPNRTWSYGLHQAIEAKENVPLTEPSKTMVKQSFQHFFSCYHRLCGASGTLQGIKGELWATYGLVTVNIPPRLPSRLEILPAAHFKSISAKMDALCTRVIRLHAQQLPVLVGTRRISDSETIAEKLRSQGVDCAVLNAQAHAQEAQIIAQAGQACAVTVATNMAGRGVDIKICETIARAGGLQVLMFEPHESRRVDWQLFGRSGRQGAPGQATLFVSSQDELLRRHLPWFARWLSGIGTPVYVRKIALKIGIRLAQRHAERFMWRQRKRLAERDRLIKDQLTFTEQGR